MSISSIRGFLYALARLLGDLNAVRCGTIGRRIVRRVIGRAAGLETGEVDRIIESADFSQ